jgi:hypothetical protein
MSHICSRALVTTLGLVLLSACGASTPTAALPSPTTTTLSCTSSGPASTTWSVPEPPSIPIVSAVVSGDTFTLTFRSGTPDFTIQQLPSAHFSQDGSGLPVDLTGNAGVRIAMTGFRGDVMNYTGPKKLDSGGPILLQVASIGDFEGYVSFGAGLSKPGCASVTTSGSTLTLHFIPTP